MSQPERTRVSRWTRMRPFAVGKYKAIQLSIERSTFERKLEKIIRAIEPLNTLRALSPFHSNNLSSGLF